VRGFAALIFLALILAITGGSVSVGIPVIVQKAISSLERRNSAGVIWLPIAFILLSLVKASSRYFESYLMARVGQSVVMRVREDMFTKFQRLSMGFYKDKGAGELISRLVSDVGAIARVGAQIMRDLVRQSITIVGLIGWVFYLNWRLALISLSLYPLIYLPLKRLSAKLHRATRKRQERAAEMATVLSESVNGAKVVRAFCMEEQEISKFRHTNKKYFKEAMRSARAKLLAEPLAEFVGSIAAAFVIWYGCRQIILGTMEIADLLSFATALGMLFGPMKKLTGVHMGLSEGSALLQRIYYVLEREPMVSDKKGAHVLPPFSDRIEFKDVYFKYPDSDEYVLKGIKLVVRKNEHVAIVGASGVGKTTLVDLIPRFYDVTKGAILIDGHDIRDVTLQSLRSQIGIVTQETFLFDDTIINNIKYGKPDASFEEVVEVAKAAYAHEFIMSLPQGYDTRVGSGGLKLSGGQRQRIAIARALLKDPAILILDEATSALDAESEALVQAALKNLMEGRTVFVIAHRLSTVIGADRILVLEDGRIVEEGTHSELMRLGRVYRQLYQLQFAVAEEG